MSTIMLVFFILQANTIQYIFEFEQQYVISGEHKIKRNIKYKYYDGEVLIINSVPKKDSACIFEKNHKVFRLKVPDSLYRSRMHIIDFDYYDQELYLLDLNRIYIFKDAGSEFFFIDYIEMGEAFVHIKVNDTTINCWASMLMGSNKNDTSHTYFYQIDKLSHKGIFHYLDDPVGVEYSLIQPRKLTDYYNGEFLVSDAIQYRILIYNEEFKVVDSLKRNEIFNHNIESSEINTNKQIKGQLSALFTASQKLTLINSVNFIDENMIVVHRSVPDSTSSDKCYFDFWVKKDSKWILAKKDIPEYAASSEENFDPQKLKIGKSLQVSNGKSLNIAIVPTDVTEYTGKTFSEYEDEISGYFYNNELKYSIMVRSLK